MTQQFDPSFLEQIDSVDEQAQVQPETVAAASALSTDSRTGRIFEAVSRGLSRQVEVANERAEEIVSFGVAPEAFQGAGNVMGIALGVSEPVSARWVAEPGVEALRVYLAEPMEEMELRQAIAQEMGADEALDLEVPIEPVVTGEIRPLPHSFRQRPAPCGISVGHFNVSAGTLGSLARGRSGNRSQRTLILSNNHVLADENLGKYRDAILQPGKVDGGTPSDQVAILERFVNIDFSGAPNFVDCATGWADPNLVRREQVYLKAGSPHYFRVDSRPRVCRKDLPVGKSGRTTQLTTGHIKTCNATVRVKFTRGTALFQDQIEIQGNDGAFSAGGDSGSLIWTNDPDRRPVGLLFAGGGRSTFANKIGAVLKNLDIDLVT